VNILRRLSLSRLLLLCGLVVAVGISATALASALGSGPVPSPKPLAQAVHDALAAPAVDGFSANVKLTDHLIEGASLASGGNGEASQFSSSPLISGASGRVWIAKDGRMRLELQAEKGDTEIYYDGHTLQAYDASTNTVYRYTPPAHEGGTGGAQDGSTPYAPLHRSASSADTAAQDHHEAPSVSKVEEAISHLEQHAKVSGASATDVAGQPTYTVRVSPKEGGSLVGGAELAWDANNGVPLRAAVYSSTSSSPVIELAATGEVSFGRVDASVFQFKPPPDAKVEELKLPEGGASKSDKSSSHGASHPTATHRGHGLAGIVVVEDKAAGGSGKEKSGLPEGLPKVKVNGATATELSTALGTLLTFERSGVHYLVAGFVAPKTVEEVARGL
jgi:outer membrane lipoprotein-sorting protein